jgi:thioredoxin-related protein
MKYFYALLLALLPTIVFSQKKSIKWYTFEEAEVLMKQQPKIILIDLYTNWCTWCKKMDKDIYQNPYVIDYINQHYYPIKFNAEHKKNVIFNGKTYTPFKKGGRTVNEMALYLTQGQLSYPSTIILEDGLNMPFVYGGYLELYQMESILVYYAEYYKANKANMNDFARNYQYKWHAKK